MSHTEFTETDLKLKQELKSEFYAYPEIFPLAHVQDLKERLQWISLCSCARDYPCDSFNVSKASWSNTLNPACGIVAHLHVISFMWACMTCFPQNVCYPAHLVSLNGHTEAALTPQGAVGGFQGGLEDVNSWSISFASLFVCVSFH